MIGISLDTFDFHVILRQAGKIRTDHECSLLLKHLDPRYPSDVIELHAKRCKTVEEIGKRSSFKVVEQPFHVLGEAMHHPERINRLRSLSSNSISPSFRLSLPSPFYHWGHTSN